MFIKILFSNTQMSFYKVAILYTLQNVSSISSNS